MNTVVKCQAKNPSTCRYHGNQGLTPMSSVRALGELQAAIEAIPRDIKASNYFDANLAVAEAEMNYSITKSGLAELEADFYSWEDEYMRQQNTPTDSFVEVIENYEQSQAKYSTARIMRVQMLTRFMDSLIDKEFGKDNTKEKRIASFGVLTFWAEAMERTDFDQELNSLGLKQSEFFAAIKDPQFSKRLTNVEKEFLTYAHEIPLPEVVSRHETLREEVRVMENIDSKILARGTQLNQEDMLSV